MKKFRNKKETNKIGLRIQGLRKTAGLNVSDIADLTGFSYTTIAAIEKGAEFTVSYLVEVAKALGVHPMELLNVPIVIKSRFPLSPQKRERKMVTQKIGKLYEETGFFGSPKFVREVVQYFREEFKMKVGSVSVSVVLKRLADSGKLKYTKVGRQNQYYKKRK